MDNIIINSNLTKKIFSFLKRVKSLTFLDLNIFEAIDKYKEINDIDFNNYYLEYVSNLPELDFESAVKISREVYKMYSKEQEFDEILKKLVDSNCISSGSLNPDEDNCIAKAHESRILLSGTYYDVVLLCHEIGHKMRYIFMNNPDIMDYFFFETPPIIFELAANDYLRDNYGVDIRADEARKIHVLSIKRKKEVEYNIFLVIMRLLKEKRLTTVNLYNEFIKEPEITEYLCKQGHSIEDSLDEVFFNYSYDIGYILGSYTNKSDNKINLLNEFLKYKDNGINAPFTIDDTIIKSTLKTYKYSK